MRQLRKQDSWNALTVLQAAERLGVHPHTIRRYLRRGLVTGTRRERGRWYISIEDLNALDRRVVERRVRELAGRTWVFSMPTSAVR